MFTKTIKIANELEYELVRKIADGGMGLVYEALQKGADLFSKQVAIKIIKEEFSSIKEFRDNFIGEARLVADLIHTNIVQTYHLGEANGRFFMVMEYVEGVNLEDFFIRHLEMGKELPIDLAVFIISRVCRGLAYAHKKKDPKGRFLNIVHRDVNPRNIIISVEGDVKLMDFGIAKARNLMYNKEGEVVAGKDEYLSPEQARKEVTDRRCDLFSCGIILSELLLGYHIFEDSKPEITRKNIEETELPHFMEEREGIDKVLNSILHKCLAKEKKNRHQSATEMLTALELYLYSDGYGPTNEKLSLYIKDLYKEDEGKKSSSWRVSKTPCLFPVKSR